MRPGPHTHPPPHCPPVAAGFPGAFTRKQLSPLSPPFFSLLLWCQGFVEKKQNILYTHFSFLNFHGILKNTASGRKAAAKLRGDKILRFQDKKWIPPPSEKNKELVFHIAAFPVHDSCQTGDINMSLTKKSGSSDLYSGECSGHFSHPTRCQGDPGKSSSLYWCQSVNLGKWDKRGERVCSWPDSPGWKTKQEESHEHRGENYLLWQEKSLLPS